jgi:hypothetical protein
LDRRSPEGHKAVDDTKLKVKVMLSVFSGDKTFEIELLKRWVFRID